MTQDRDERHVQDARTEALPTTQELHATQPLPAAAPVEAGSSSSPPPSVPPADRRPGSGEAAPAAGRRRSTVPWVLVIAAVSAVALAVIASSLWTLANRPGQVVVVGTTPTTTEASASPSPVASATPSPTPSDSVAEDATDDSAPVATDDTGPPGANGACESEIVDIDRDDDDEFEVEIRITARAGGVDGWHADIDLDGAELVDVDKVEVVSQTGDIYTVEGAGKTAQIDSGKSIKFTIEAEGDIGDIAVGCHA